MRRTSFTLGLLAIITIAWPLSAMAQTGRSDWDASDHSRVRLLLLPANADGTMAGGIEVQLEPGWHTYWKVPGDAGVPPQFDFSGSENVADVTVKFPVPERYVAYGTVSVVYHERVVFPLEVKVADPGKPVALTVDMFYGACADVCIPVKSKVTTNLMPDSEPDPLARLGIEEFQGRLPGQPDKGFSIVGAAAKDGTVTIDAVVPPETEKVDLFVKGPDTWYTGQPKLVSRSEIGATFSLSMKGIPDGADPSGKFDMLLVADDRGILQESVGIDLMN